MTFKRDYRSFDFILAALVLGLLLFGIIMVGSAEHIDRNGMSRLFKMHMLWAASGFVLMLVVAFVDFQFVCRFFIAMYAVNLLLLLLVLVVGEETNGTVRWLYLSNLGLKGIEVGIQPSEFTKVFMIVYLAKIIDKYREQINYIPALALIILVAAVPIVLIAIQPSLSAALVSLVVLVTMLFTAKISWKYVAVVLALVIPLAILVYYDLHNENQLFLHRIMGPYQQNRIRVWLDPTIDPDKWFQSQRSIDAIRSGQLTGRGLFQNTIAVPYSSNDFIFAVIGAELGFVGCVAVIFVILIVVLRCFRIAYRSDVFLGRLLAAGTGSVIAFQTFVNVSVATGTMPNTGITLPFISSGGSSMWITLVAVGLVLSVGMTRQKSMFED